ncbi:MAG: TIGR00730 family Rossman fold protein [Actinomycetota bacterium]
MAKICVYCGSNTGRDPRYAEAATELGQTLGADGHGLVYGGGNVGLMGVVADAALGAGADVIGVMTEQLVQAEVAHRGLTELEILPSMHARKARMAELADGIIVLPGGFGTWEEAVELLTWNQLGLASAAVVFLDLDGYYRPFFDLVAGAVDAGFVSPDNAALAQRATTVAEAVERASSAAPASTPKWTN